MFKSFIIGCGNIAGFSTNQIKNNFTHGYAYDIIEGVVLAGCMDIDVFKAKKFAKLYNTKSYKDYIDGIRKTRAEIISICSPDDTHYSIVKSLLKLDTHIKVIFIEKPVCSSVDEINDLIQLSEKRIELIANHTRRFDLRYKKIRYNISKGFYGELIECFSTYYSGWAHNGVHVVDTLSYLFDDEISIKSLKKGAKSLHDSDLSLDGELFFKNKPGLIKLFSFDESFYQLFEFDLRFAKARLRLEDFGFRFVIEKKEINDIGENILVPKDNDLHHLDSNPIQVAIQLIINFLQKKVSNQLYGYRVKDISNTMKTIWEGIKIYES